MKKRILSMLLVLCMVLSILPTTAFAEGGSEAITGTITADSVWEDGAVVAGVTISGGTSAEPIEITVNGTVTVTGTIRLAPDSTSNVVFKAGTDGATLIRGEGFTGQMFYSEGISGSFQSLTFNGITLDGGAVWTGDVDATLNRGKTNSGIAATGSILYLVYSNATLNDSTLQNHDDSTGEKANAVFLRYYSAIEFNRSIVRNNNSISTYYRGGVITVRQGGTVKTNNAEVYGNSGIKGGFFGTSSTGSYGGIVEVYNSKFHNNYANDGAVFDMQCNSNRGYLLIDGCEFYDNASERGLIYEHAYSRPVTIKNSTFRDNDCAVWDCHADPELGLSGKIVIENNDYTGYFFETPIVLSGPLAEGSSIPINEATLVKLGGNIVSGTAGYNVTEDDIAKFVIPEGYKVAIADINGDGFGDVIAADNAEINTEVTLTLKDSLDAEASTTAKVYAGIECLPVNPFAHDGLDFTGWVDASGNPVAKQKFTVETTLTAQWKIVMPTANLSREDATLKVTVTNAFDTQTYTYQWYKGDNAIDGATGSTYTMTDINSASYTCKVTASMEGFEPVTGSVSATSSAPAVAQISETKYATLVQAVAAATAVEGSATITLLKDTVLGEKLTIAGNVTISGEYTITRADNYTGTLFAVNAGAALTLDGGVTIDGGNNYAFDKAAFMADCLNRTQVTKEDSAKWFTPEEGAPVATAFMMTTTGGKINLNKVTIQNNYSTGSGVVSAGANSTISLTGAKITHVAATQGNGIVANVSGAGINVTVNEGTVIDSNHVGGNHGIFKIYSGAKLTMNGGEITNNTGWNSNGTVVGLWGSGGGIGSTFIMNGGSICSNAGVYGPSNGRNAAIYGHTQHVFIMNGGTICHNTGAYGGLDAPYSNGTTQINGGSIVNNVSSTDNPYADINGNSVLTITGGTFTQDVAQWLAPDTGLVYDEESGMFSITEDVYEYNGDKYKNLADIIADIKGSSAVLSAEADEVKVIANHNISETVVIDIPLTLDLNAHTIYATGTVNPAFRILADVTFTGEGMIDSVNHGDGYCFIVGNTEAAGYLTIESGTYKGACSAVSVTKGTANIEGGTFKVEKADGAEDGDFRYMLNCIDANYKDGSAKIEVSGGSFYGFDPANNAAEGEETNFMAAGYKSVSDEQTPATYTVSKITYTITAAATENGSIAPYGSIIVEHGGSQTFTFTPDEGYELDSVKLNGAPVEVSGNSYTMENVTEDAGLAVSFKPKSYTVTWSVDGAETTETYSYGETPVYDGTPAKASTAQYTYTFTGWDKELAPVTGNVTYTAVFGQTVNKYTVIFLDEDGAELQSGEVAYGETPVYSGETPTKTADASKTYSFAGWTPAITAVTGNATYTATYTDSAHKYTVTFYDEDGTTVLETAQWAYGSTPSFTGETPTKVATAQYTYTFDKWEAVSGIGGDGKITGTASYKATYTAEVNSYSVKWSVDGSETTETYSYGETPAYEGTPAKAATAQYTYSFTGWNKEIAPVTGNVTYTAQFSSTVNRYTVKWNVEGVETTETYDYGAMPQYKGETPEKAATEDHTYTFAGWTPAVSAVTGNVTYTAQFTSAAIPHFTVIFKDGDAVISESDYAVGTVITAPQSPAKEGHTFTGWLGYTEGMTATTHLTFTAAWSVNTYTLTAEAGTGGSISPAGSVTAEYGSSKTFTVAAGDGYIVSGVTVDGSAVELVDGSYTFESIAADHSISAEFIRLYNITVTSTEGGSVSYILKGTDEALPMLSGKGEGSVSTTEDEITLIIDPDLLWTVESVNVNGEFAILTDGRCVIENISDDIAVEVSFRRIPVSPGGTGGYVTPSKPEEPDTSDEPDTPAHVDCSHGVNCVLYPFTDITKTAWYFDAVHYCVENKLMNGVGTSTFAPEAGTSRAMIVTILWRMAGEPTTDYAMSFDDVAAGQWYTEAVRWAAAEGIVDGYSANAFGPNDNITREQMATILWRYAKYMGVDVSTGENVSLEAYNDEQFVNAWALSAMQWACGSGMVEGKPGGLLDPTGGARRCEAATLMMRFCENILK